MLALPKLPVLPMLAEFPVLELPVAVAIAIPAAEGGAMRGMMSAMRYLVGTVSSGSSGSSSR